MCIWDCEDVPIRPSVSPLWSFAARLRVRAKRAPEKTVLIDQPVAPLPAVAEQTPPAPSSPVKAP